MAAPLRRRSSGPRDARARRRSRPRACRSTRRAAACSPRISPRSLTQPPFDASAMDGYAVRAADVATLPATLRLIGEAARGRGFEGKVGQRRGGAHLHRRAGAEGRRHRRHPGEHREADGVVTVKEAAPRRHIRPRGQDFREGEVAARAGTQARPARADARRRHEPCRASRAPQAQGRDPRHRR